MLLFGRRSGAGPDSANGGTCGKSCSGNNSSSTNTDADGSGGSRMDLDSGSTCDSSSSNTNTNGNSDTDTQRTPPAAQRTPEELQKRATAMREAMVTCSGLKEQYDRCFNHWYRRHFLRGDMSRNCFHLFADYRLCISEELKRKGLE